MSIASSPRPTDQSQPAEPPPARPPDPWRWMIAACLVLAASGAVRVAEERRFGIASENATKAPFPLRDLPMKLGDNWTNRGGEQVIDEETLQIAGAVEYTSRTYVDERTGVMLEALVVFGAAENVFPHAPTICFPSFGFELAGGAQQHLIKTDSGTAVFESLIYVKPAVEASRTEVYYSFWHDDRWSPVAAQTSKRFRHHPEMFKIQVQRLVGPNERRTGDARSGELSPIEDFLGYLVPELERRMAAAGIGPAAPGSATPAPEARPAS